MTNIIAHPNLNSVQSMTLKEITDMLDVRHNDAMATVERMAQDSAFGAFTKISYMVNIGSGAQRAIETYQLDKRQSIAVAARLNVAMLMRIVDRWQELENQQQQATISHAAVQAMITAEVSRQLGRGQPKPLKDDRLDVSLLEWLSHYTGARREADWSYEVSISVLYANYLIYCSNMKKRNSSIRSFTVFSRQLVKVFPKRKVYGMVVYTLGSLAEAKATISAHYKIDID